MNIVTGMAAILALTAGTFAVDINLSGTVKDIDGAAISGAVVSLNSDNTLKDTTDVSGAFTLTNVTGINRFRSIGISPGIVGSIRVKGDQLQLSIGTSADNGTVTIFSSNGKRSVFIPLGRMEAGSYQQTLPALAAGTYIMHCVVGDFSARVQLIALGDGTFMAGGNPDVNSIAGVSRSAAATAVDTLIAVKEGFDTLKKAITTYIQENIALEMKKKSTGPTLPPITDYSSKGPFETVKETRVGPNNGYTVFRPKTLGENGFLHAPIVFGPGIGQTVEPVHTEMLTNFASHGFVVVGTPVLNEGPNGAQNLKTMKDGLNWIVKENTTAGSKYEGKLWADHCVSMGFSVGGTSAVEMGGEDSVITVVSIHGHKAEAALHGTMLQTSGTADNVGLPMQQWTFDRSKVPTFMATKTGAPHQEIERNGGGDERKAIVAWMRYRIYNDMGAKSYFYGDDCVLCKAPWENPQRKNWDE
jgi:dienelactone hydrolase